MFNRAKWISLLRTTATATKLTATATAVITGINVAAANISKKYLDHLEEDRTNACATRSKIYYRLKTNELALTYIDANPNLCDAVNLKKKLELDKMKLESDYCNADRTADKLNYKFNHHAFFRYNVGFSSISRKQDALANTLTEKFDQTISKYQKP